MRTCYVGETVADFENPVALPTVSVDEPTLTMTFRVNDSPLSGREGRFVTSRHLRDRLMRELERNVALRVEETDSPDSFVVAGRGDSTSSILLETMRREGYELAVSRPEVILRGAGDALEEPYEELVVDVPEVPHRRRHRGSRTPARQSSRTSSRCAASRAASSSTSRRVASSVPRRVPHLDQGIRHHAPRSVGATAPPFLRRPARTRGSLVASETGDVTSYALDQFGDRGTFFISPSDTVYRGQVVGEHTRERDLDLNVCKRKHVTNVRNATAEEAVRLSAPRILSLEDALEFLAQDELLELTPQSLRIRKQVLDAEQRARILKQRTKEQGG